MAIGAFHVQELASELRCTAEEILACDSENLNSVVMACQLQNYAAYLDSRYDAIRDAEMKDLGI